jgi:hypothetical protein
MERPDLFQDDLTEERYPSPARRDDEAKTQTLDPDASADGNDAARSIRPAGARAESAPGGPDDDEDDEEDEDDDD